MKRRNWSTKIKAAFADPGLAVSVVLAMLRGYLFRFELILSGSRKVSIGRGLRIYSRLYICGPGKVVIGRNFSCNRNVFKDTAITTHHPDAVVKIGEGNFLGGTQISCVKSVEIGDDNLFANTVIMDSDIIPHPNMKLDAEWMEKWTDGIHIQDRVWLAANTVVMKGVTVGNECVLSAGSVAATNAEPRSLLMGVPARKIKSTREEP